VAATVEKWLDEHPEATTTVADGSITPNKTSFLYKKTINLYNPAEATEGRFGEQTQEYTTSGYIPVKKAVYNATTRPWYIQLYNDGVKVQEFSPATNTIDLTVYTEDFDTLRMATYGATVPNNMMFVEGELPNDYIAYESAENVVTSVTDETIKRTFNNNAYNYLLERGFPTESLDFIEPHICNLCDFSKAGSGYVGEDGKIVPNSSVYVSDFIPVEEGAKYYGCGSWQSGFYDKDKKFVKNFAGADLVDGAIIVPVGENIAYMRATVAENTVIAKDFDATSYIPPTKSFRLNDDYARKDFRAYLMGTYGVRWFAVGDSITFGTNADKSYVTIISEDWLYSATNYGLAGTRLTTTTGHGNSMCERIKTYDETKCDIITIAGGTNDKSVEIGTMDDTGTTTVYGALKDICNTLLTKYAGKRYGFITPLKYRAGETHAVTEAIKEVAAYYNIPVIDMETEFGYLFDYTADTQAMFCEDGLHPNGAGQALMARKIASWLLTL
jgi:lysophospholipase L1-like esterase